jgi:hypothetical protein
MIKHPPHPTLLYAGMMSVLTQMQSQTSSVPIARSSSSTQQQSRLTSVTPQESQSLCLVHQREMAGRVLSSHMPWADFQTDVAGPLYSYE